MKDGSRKVCGWVVRGGIAAVGNDSSIEIDSISIVKGDRHGAQDFYFVQV